MLEVAMIYVDVKEWLLPYLSRQQQQARWEISISGGRLYMACFYDTGSTGAYKWLYSWAYMNSDHVESLIDKLWSQIELYHGGPIE